MLRQQKRWVTVAQIQFQITYTNLDFPEWGEAFPGNKMIGAATLDRLRHGAHKIVLDGESYRGLKPGVESPRTELAKGGKIKQP